MSPRKKAEADGLAQQESHIARDGGEPIAAHKRGLSRDGIVKAALTIIDRDGYEALSMRRLGKELGVNPMAVYYHIPNKSALLDALVEVVMNELDLALDDPSRPVADRLLTAAQAYRGAMLSHPSLIQFVAHRPPRTLSALRPVEVLFRIFSDAGFSTEDAFAAVNIFATYVRGCVIREAPFWFQMPESDEVEDSYDFTEMCKMLDPEEFPNMAKASCETGFLGFEAEFDRGARALIRGLLEMYGKEEVAKHV